ncbi:5-bromo-4-chloroindolyl phosphate hydrolysis family protein [Paracoccus caeni]|uniref:5-bromo-4-chloroindolyl phosphate hydrolysis family protein n=1 Tax=Paracoccus caeni TaxID=657651 RepID=A0A934S9L7_9RHOB|nr:5-bromo-4-chloroindolyl phosphate hydrolysis family protein [Paracoccus caeni]MBK4214686.1 5-bromo-4-chloroindolyl phosphate hydrolysis family protein [Paracoccus caeni]
MSERFGGRYSPDGSRRDHRNAEVQQTLPEPRIRHRLAGRPKWVTIASSPFLALAFFQSPTGMFTDLAAFGLIASGMWMTREGLVAEAAYEVRRVAKRPAIPRKLFGGVLAALGLGIGVAEPGVLTDGVLVGVAGMILHVLSFGTDPMRDKGATGVDDFQQDRAHRMIQEAEDLLDQMRDAILRAGDLQLERRVDRFAATVEGLFDRVRDNPGDLSGARRYMGIYLMGARDATVKFASLYGRTRDASVRASYETFLDDLEKDFKAKSRKLLDSDRSDLDIEISVLRDRLMREGVQPETEPKALVSDQAQTLDDLLSYDVTKEKTR